jgi:hypothetical protein
LVEEEGEKPGWCVVHGGRGKTELIQALEERGEEAKGCVPLWLGSVLILRTAQRF